MVKNFKLSARVRHGLESARDVAFGNPFAPDRAQLEQSLAVVKANATEAQRYQALAGGLDALLDALGISFTDEWPLLTEDERTLIEHALALRAFYRHSAAIDAHIADQARHDEPRPALWVRAVLQELQAHGLAPARCILYAELFFQLRRALRFIRNEITGACPAVVHLRMRLWNTLFTIDPQWYLKYLHGRMHDFSVLLLGETGTGKTAAARVIGHSGYIKLDTDSSRFKESFARGFSAINLAEYPSSLVESQLFGHRKGAFTGAVDTHRGLFARCGEYGTVFIDEIGDVDLSTQTKLLRVLQDREFTPVGGNEKLKFRGRVIAATNKDVAKMRKVGEFRDDFYYRLCSDVITIPPLRERIAENPAELGLILNALIQRAIGEHTEPLARQVEERINQLLPPDYSWPGNVRELEQCVRRICVSGEYGGDTDTLAPRFGDRDMLTMTADQLLAVYCRTLYAKYGTYEGVAKAAALDRRTVRKYIEQTRPE